MAKIHREWDSANTVMRVRGVKISISQMAFIIGGLGLALVIFKMPLGHWVFKAFLALIPATIGIAMGMGTWQGKPLYRWLAIASTFWRQPRRKVWKRVITEQSGGLFFSKKGDSNGTSQSLLNVKAIRNNLILLKDGSYRAVLRVSGINMALLATTERKRVYQDFKGFLNTLRFPVQVLIRLRRQDIDTYLDFVADRVTKTPEGQLKDYTISYGEWVEKRVEINRLMSRERYVIIPWATRAIDQGIKGMLKIGDMGDEFSDLDSVADQLGHRVDTVRSGLARMGLDVEFLKNDDLKKLIYESWNPNLSEVQKPTTHDTNFAVRGRG
jgi:hypothetical protein